MEAFRQVPVALRPQVGAFGGAHRGAGAVDAPRRYALFPQPVQHADAHAHFVHIDPVGTPLPRHRDHRAGQGHGVAFGEHLDVLHDIAPAQQRHAAVGAVARHIHAQRHRRVFRPVGQKQGDNVVASAVARRGQFAGGVLRFLNVVQRNQIVVPLLGELAQDAGLERGAALAPGIAPFLNPLRSGHTGNDNAPRQHIGRLQRRDGNGFVEGLFPVKGVIKAAAGPHRIADEHQPGVGGSYHALDGLVDVIGNALGFVHDDQQVGAMEPLEAVGAGGGEAQGVAVGGQLPAGVQQLAAQGRVGPAVQGVQLPPEHIAHLPESGRGAQHDGRVVGVHEPQGGYGGGKVLAQPVARFDGHPLAAGQRLQGGALLVPQRYAQDFGGEAFRVDRSGGGRIELEG